MQQDRSQIRSMWRDAEALILYAAALCYLLIPQVWATQIDNRMDDPVFITLLGIATGGRFAIRAMTARQPQAIVNNVPNVAVTEEPQASTVSDYSLGDEGTGTATSHGGGE